MAQRIPYLILAEKNGQSGDTHPPSMWLYPELRSVAQAKEAGLQSGAYVLLSSGYICPPPRARQSTRKAFTVLVSLAGLEDEDSFRHVLHILADRAFNEGRKYQREVQRSVRPAR